MRRKKCRYNKEDMSYKETQKKSPKHQPPTPTQTKPEPEPKHKPKPEAKPIPLLKPNLIPAGPLQLIPAHIHTLVNHLEE